MLWHPWPRCFFDDSFLCARKSGDGVRETLVNVMAVALGGGIGPAMGAHRLRDRLVMVPPTGACRSIGW